MSSGRKRNVSIDSEKNSPTAGDQFPKKAGERLPRAAKKKRLSLTAVVTDQTEAEKSVITNVDNSKQSTRVKRQAWTSTGIASFFEGLSEHGKDFGRILHFMQTRQKKKQHDPFIGNLTKNQVRFFYYRTWHKVSSLLSLADREIHSPTQRSVRKGAVPQLTTLSQDSNRGCGGSDDETEGEVEAGFDISLDEGDEITDHVPDESETIQSGSHTHQNHPSPFTPGHTHLSEPSPNHGHNSDPSPNDQIHTHNSPIVPSLTEIECYSIEGTINIHGNSSNTTNVYVEGEGDVGEGYSGAVKVERKKGDNGGMVKVNGMWQSLDLVAMICYSKLRQKCQGDKTVLGKKLRELVHQGVTTIRMKGKRKIQMKTPNCPALKSTKGNHSLAPVVGMNEIGNASEVSSLLEPPVHPEVSSQVTIELRPLNSCTWAYVQHLSMNPRLRILMPSKRTVKELFHFIATKWHILPSDIFHILKLYKFTNTSEENSSVAVLEPNSQFVASKSGQRGFIGCESSTGYLKMVDEVTREKIGVEMTVLQPLKYDSVTSIGELREKVPDKSNNRITLKYEICQKQAPPFETTNLNQLFRIANFLTTAHKTTPPPTLTSPSPTTPPSLVTTPIPVGITPSQSSPVLLSSPAVIHYMKTLPKKSPIKSPLAKYRRMKQLRPSPLKTMHATTASLTNLHSSIPTKPTFTASQLSPTSHFSPAISSSIFDTNITLIPPVSQSIQNFTPLSQQLLSTSTTTQSSSTTVSSPLILTTDVTSVSTSSPETFSLTKLNAEKKGREKPPAKVHHLVTVSKKSLRHSGSFARLRLHDLFQSVNDNLKEAKTDDKEEKGATQDTTGDIKKWDLSQPIPTQSNIQTQRHTDNVILPVSNIPSITFSEEATLTTNTTTSSFMTESSVFDEVPIHLPHHSDVMTSSVSITVPNAPSITSLPDPSPLQQLASKVAAGGTGLNIRTLSKASSQVNISPATITTSTPTNTLTAPSGGPISKMFIKPTRRGRTLTKLPNSQRPVVPKPLIYLPQMAQMALAQKLDDLVTSKSSLQLSPSVATSAKTPLRNTSQNNTSSSMTSITTITLPPPSITSTSSSTTTTFSQTAPIIHSNVISHPPNPVSTNALNVQLLQAQVSLLQNMLLKTAQQQQQQQQQQAIQSMIHSLITLCARDPSILQQLNLQALANAALSSNQLTSFEDHSTVNTDLASIVTSSATSLHNPVTSSLVSTLTRDTGTIEPPLSFGSDIPALFEDNPQTSLDVANTEYTPTSYQIQPPNTSNTIPVYTSSDTVAELLRGLSSYENDKNSIQRLSEETVDVLPTFAHAMVQMSTDASNSNKSEFPSTSVQSSTQTINSFSTVPLDLPHRDSPGTTDSLMAFLQNENSGLNAFSDSSMKNIVETTDFSDMFSQLKDILKTPDKGRTINQGGGSVDGSSRGVNLSPPQERSVGGLIDVFHSPFKRGSTEHNSETFRSILEENSVDYINKFKELASAMNQSSQS